MDAAGFEQGKYHSQVVVAPGAAIEHQVGQGTFISHFDAVPAGQFAHDLGQGFAVKIEPAFAPGRVLVGIDLLYAEGTLLKDALLAGQEPVYRCVAGRCVPRCGDINPTIHECRGGSSLVGICIDIELRTDHFNPLVATVNDKRLVGVFRNGKIGFSHQGDPPLGVGEPAGVGERGSGVEPDVGTVR